MLGYSLEFCYICIIKPDGLPPLVFSKDSMKVSAIKGVVFVFNFVIKENVN